MFIFGYITTIILENQKTVNMEWYVDFVYFKNRSGTLSTVLHSLPLKWWFITVVFILPTAKQAINLILYKLRCILEVKLAVLSIWAWDILLCIKKLLGFVKRKFLIVMTLQLRIIKFIINISKGLQPLTSSLTEWKHVLALQLFQIFKQFHCIYLKNSIFFVLIDFHG